MSLLFGIFLIVAISVAAIAFIVFKCIDKICPRSLREHPRRRRKREGEFKKIFLLKHEFV
jgi:hypothetical protein